MKKILAFLTLVIGTGVGYSQNTGNTPSKGNRFDEAAYKAGKLIEYPIIPSSQIGAVRLRHVKITPEDPVNVHLFHPDEQQAGFISLFDLIVKGIREWNIPAWKSSDFDAVWEREKFLNYVDSFRVEPIEDFSPDHGDWRLIEIVSPMRKFVSGYFILETEILGVKGQTLEKRVIGLAPVIRELDDVNVIPFWMYFADIMPLLSHHLLSDATADVRTTLDFFRKGNYRGEYVHGWNYGTSKPYDWLRETPGATWSEEWNGWIYEQGVNGVFVDTRLLKYQGNNGVNKLPDYAEVKPEKRSVKGVTSALLHYELIKPAHQENLSIFYPEYPFMGSKNLAALLLDGIREERFPVYAPYDFECHSKLSNDEAETFLGKATIKIDEFDENGEVIGMRDYLVEVEPSRIKEYYIRKALFFDASGRKVYEEVLGLIVMAEQGRYSGWGEFESLGIHKPAVFVSFREPQTAGFLAARIPYQFQFGERGSFLDFFRQGKYSVSHTYMEPVTLSAAVNGVSLAKIMIASTASSATLPAINPSENASLAIRRVKRNTSAIPSATFNYAIDINLLHPYDARVLQLKSLTNHPLFYPMKPTNGYINLFDYLKESLVCGGLTAYQYREGELWGNAIGQEEIAKRFSLLMRVYGLVDDYEMENQLIGKDTLSIDPFMMSSWLILELITGDKQIPIAIGPDYDFLISNGPNAEHIEKPETDFRFWVPLDAAFKAVLNWQQALNFNSSTPQSLGSWLYAGGYQGELIHKAPITAAEAAKLPVFGR